MAAESARPGAQAGQAPRKRKPQPRQKHIPQRTCIACRETRPKRELIRVVRTPEGHIELDPTSKKSGRGAYVCARRSCWDIALKKGKLEHEFEMKLSEEDRAALEVYYASLPPEEPDAPAPARAAKAPKK
ncbi:MAG: YlxR family protein [Chloroflexota bacterium]|nr:YlxR family protein [Chloroflexota bacterium]